MDRRNDPPPPPLSTAVAAAQFVMAEWGAHPLSTLVMDHGVANVLAPAPGVPTASMLWDPAPVPPHVAASLMHRPDQFLNPLAHAIGSVAQSIPLVTLRDTPPLRLALPTVLPAYPIGSTPLPDALLRHSGLPPAPPTPVPKRPRVALPFFAPERSDADWLAAMVGKYAPTVSAGAAAGGMSTTPLSSGTATPTPASVAAAASATAAAPTKSKRKKEPRAAVASSSNNNGKADQQPSSPMVIKVKAPAPKPSPKIAPKPELVVVVERLPAIASSMEAFLTAPTADTPMSRAVLTQLFAAAGSSKLSLSPPQAEVVADRCLGYIAAAHSCTILQPRGDNEDGDTDASMDELGEDEAAAEAWRYIRVLAKAESALEAAAVLAAVWNAHWGLASTERATMVGELVRNHLIQSVLPVYDARDAAAAADAGTTKSKGKGKGSRNSGGHDKVEVDMQSLGVNLPVHVVVHNKKFSSHFARTISLMGVVLPKLQTLIASHPAAESLGSFGIALSYGALAPLFVTTPVDRTLRSRALEFIMAVSAVKPDLRAIIVDETVANLIKFGSSAAAANGPDGAARARLQRRAYDMPAGPGIQMATALVLHLVQSIATSPPPPTPAKTELALVPALATTTNDNPLDQCKLMIAQLLQYLLTRATKKVKINVTNEVEYLDLLRKIFEDVVTVLPSPEFPAAELVARVTLQLLLGVMEDESVNDNAVKGLALDVFSLLLCHIRRLAVAYADTTPAELSHAQAVVRSYLTRFATDDPGLGGALRYYECEWEMRARTAAAQQKAAAARTADAKSEAAVGSLGGILSDSDNEEEGDDAAPPLVPPTAASRTEALEAVSLLLVHQSTLPKQTEPLLGCVLKWFEAKEVPVRSRAVKVLSAVVQEDPSLMELPYIQASIGVRLRDSSPSVRDSVLEVVGKWLLATTGPVPPMYLAILLERTMDKSISVRKRAIRTLGQVASRLGVAELVEVATRMFLRLNDEEDTVADVAKKILFEILFPSTSTVSARSDKSKAGAGDFDDGNDDEAEHGGSSAKAAQRAFKSTSGANRIKALAQAAIFCGMTPRVDADALVLFLRLKARKRLGVLPAALFQSVETADPQSLAMFNGLASLAVLARAVPSAISGDMLAFCSNLLPIPERTPMTEDLTRQTSLCLTVLREALIVADPGLTPAAAVEAGRGPGGSALWVALQGKQLEELELNVLRLVQNGPTAITLDAVAVASLVGRRRQQPKYALALLKASFENLARARTALGDHGDGTLPANLNEASLRRLLTILGGLVQFGAFSPTVVLTTGTPGPAPADSAQFSLDTAFALVRYFGATPFKDLAVATRAVAIHALKCMSLQFGSRLLQPPVLALLRGAFAECITEVRLTEAALELVVTYMAREDVNAAEKQRAEADDFDRQAFMGTTMEFASSGIAESLSQTFVSDFARCALLPPTEPNRRVVELAQEILGFIASNRLAHPKLVMPAVVALQSSPWPQVALIARSHHLSLHASHQSTIYDANRDAVIAACEFQALVQNTRRPIGYTAMPAAGGGGGYLLAHLATFYTVIRDGKRDRKAFLQLLVRFFEWKLSATTAAAGLKGSHHQQGEPRQVDVTRCRWIADNLATLEYKHEDELMVVLQMGNATVSGVGLSIRSDLNAPTVSSDGPTEAKVVRETRWSRAGLVRGAACVSLLVAAKSHLARAYHVAAAKVRTYQDGSSSGTTTGSGAAAATPAAPLGSGTAARNATRHDDIARSYACPLTPEVLDVLVGDDTAAVEALAPQVLEVLDRAIDRDPVQQNGAAADSSSTDGNSVPPTRAARKQRAVPARRRIEDRADTEDEDDDDDHVDTTDEGTGRENNGTDDLSSVATAPSPVPVAKRARRAAPAQAAPTKAVKSAAGGVAVRGAAKRAAATVAAMADGVEDRNSGDKPAKRRRRS